LKKIDVRGETGDSKIIIGDSISNIESYVDASRIIVITDSIVKKNYGKFFSGFETIEISQGEKNKNLKTAEKIYDELLELEADRSSFIVGAGGGIVCDITGFVSSTFMRGVKYGFFPTTLLSQVDAAIGGKNGVNLRGYKNIIGTINQPEFVVCDLSLLKTLPDREYLCGLSEVIKSALIGDTQLFSSLEKNFRGILERNPSLLEKIVYDSAFVKVGIVEKDEKDRVERRKLNFGHTIGHAFEKVCNITHGEAVCAGMLFAIEFSVRKKLISPEVSERIKKLLSAMGFSMRVSADTELLKDALRKDKKREGDIIHFVFLKKIGEVLVEEISISELEGIVDDMYKYRKF